MELGTIGEVSYEGLLATQVNWIQKKFPRDLDVKVRYQKNEIPSWVDPDYTSGQASVRFKVPGTTVSPGQAAVFYHGDEVIGGGTIVGSVAWEVLS
ncbi:MAG: tRNA-specific 2-thiouridylase mnmA [uncultured bacterium]|nr:MAG: tRNA-specific 2-thiouridylase mnmA [uncultured bacterium]